MEWSNYLFANGGEYYDANWKPTLNTPAGVAAVEDYKAGIQKYGPVGSASFSFIYTGGYMKSLKLEIKNNESIVSLNQITAACIFFERGKFRVTVCISGAGYHLPGSD